MHVLFIEQVNELIEEIVAARFNHFYVSKMYIFC
jgi:hypothetical protein